MSVCLITWDGPCQTHGRWHACKRGCDHRGRHICSCEATSTALLNITEVRDRPRERPERIYQKAHGTVPRRTRAWQRRDPAHYLPKYMKRKRGMA